VENLSTNENRVGQKEYTPNVKNRPHNTLLHGDVPRDVQNASTSNASNEEEVVSQAARGQTLEQVLLATA